MARQGRRCRRPAYQSPAARVHYHYSPALVYVAPRQGAPVGSAGPATRYCWRCCRRSWARVSAPVDLPYAKQLSPAPMHRVTKPGASRPPSRLMTHKYRGCIVVLSINKSVEPNEEQKVLTRSFGKDFTVNTSRQVFRGF